MMDGGYNTLDWFNSKKYYATGTKSFSFDIYFFMANKLRCC